MYPFFACRFAAVKPIFDSLTVTQKQKVEAWKRRGLPKQKKCDATPFKYDKKMGAGGELSDVAFPRLIGWERDAVEQLREKIARINFGGGEVVDGWRGMSEVLGDLKGEVGVYKRAYDEVAKEGESVYWT